MAATRVRLSTAMRPASSSSIRCRVIPHTTSLQGTRILTQHPHETLIRGSSWYPACAFSSSSSNSIDRAKYLARWFSTTPEQKLKQKEDANEKPWSDGDNIKSDWKWKDNDEGKKESKQSFSDLMKELGWPLMAWYWGLWFITLFSIYGILV